MNKYKFLSAIAAIFFFTYFLCSCNENSPLTTQGAAGTSVSMMSNTTGNPVINGLSIDNAKFLIEFIKLEREHGTEGENIKIGPFVVDVSMDNRVTKLALNNVPAGTYNEVHIKIHKHTPGETVVDPDFGTDGPGYSGIIVGSYNGNNFIYRSAITVSREIDIDPNIVVATTGSTIPTNITIVIDPALWFKDDNGNTLNPMDEANRHKIDDNIKDSFRQAFRDDDCDGHPDHGH